MMTAGKNGKVLHGDWRRRVGTKTDAHLYRNKAYDARPVCLRTIL